MSGAFRAAVSLQSGEIAEHMEQLVAGNSGIFRPLADFIDFSTGLCYGSYRGLSFTEMAVFHRDGCLES